MDTLPLMICKHYNVEWIDSHTCKCADCGKEGHWTERGYAIWVRKEPLSDREIRTQPRRAVASRPHRSKVA